MLEENVIVFFYHKLFKREIFELMTGALPVKVKLYLFNKKKEIKVIKATSPAFIDQKITGPFFDNPLFMFIPKIFVKYVPTDRAIITIARVVSAISNSLRKESSLNDICWIVK